MHPVRQPIEHRPGQAFAAAAFRPLLERQIGRDDQALPLVGLADHLEQQFRPGLGEGHVAQFVQDQQILPAQLLEHAFQSAILPGLQ